MLLKYLQKAVKDLPRNTETEGRPHNQPEPIYMNVGLEMTTYMATSENQVLFTAWTTTGWFTNHLPLYLLPQNTIFISVHYYLSQLQDYGYIKRGAKIKI